MVVCEVCGGSYTLPNFRFHKNTKKHRLSKDITQFEEKYKLLTEEETKLKNFMLDSLSKINEMKLKIEIIKNELIS